jgi:hypothetical protein
VDNRRLALNSPTVIGEAIDGEVMVINLVSGIYYNLTGTAASAWPLLTAGLPLNEIVARLKDACGVSADTVERDLSAFVDALVSESIVRAADDAVEPLPAPPVAVVPYSGFALNRYDDMRALLVVDPVHEVGDFGWPQRPEPRNTPR